MNNILLWKIIPFLGAIIHSATSGWLTWSGSIDIFTFIKEPLIITPQNSNSRIKLRYNNSRNVSIKIYINIRRSYIIRNT